MAITGVGNGGIVGSSTTSATWTAGLATTALADGDWLVLVVVTDNVQTTSGASSTHSMVGGSLSYSKLGEWTNGQGAAGDGVTVSAWLARNLTGSKISTNNISMAFTGGVTERCANSYKFSAGDNLALVSGSVVGNTVDASTGFGSATISGLPSVERVWFRAAGKEANSTATLATTSGYTGLTSARSRNNAAAVLTRSEWLISTATGETSNPSLSASGDTAAIFFALSEGEGEPSAPTLLVASAHSITSTSFRPRVTFSR